MSSLYWQYDTTAMIWHVRVATATGRYSSIDALKAGYPAANSAARLRIVWLAAYSKLLGGWLLSRWASKSRRAIVNHVNQLVLRTWRDRATVLLSWLLFKRRVIWSSLQAIRMTPPFKLLTTIYMKEVIRRILNLSRLTTKQQLSSGSFFKMSVHTSSGMNWILWSKDYRTNRRPAAGVGRRRHRGRLITHWKYLL